MKAQKQALLFVVITTFFTTTGQFFWKKGADLSVNGAGFLIYNYWSVIGFFLYAFGALFLILALRLDNLSKVFPVVATSYVWVVFLSPLFFAGENYTLFKSVGAIMVLFGVIMVNTRFVGENND
ncbi:hypothetical protein GOV04_03935 [Candidatus Woesearchaeota archaeon]|nr:hypothetical protein [Candidatus Woesearchaeota archaeon]